MADQQYKAEHNFYRVDKHPKNSVDALGRRKVVWRCDDCDTEILLPDVMDRGEVNRGMANRMLCIKPEPGRRRGPLVN